MQLEQPSRLLFEQLDCILKHITPTDYSRSLVSLNASIGQHMRHIIELFLELGNGYDNGLVNYELRKRDYQLETDTSFARLKLIEIGERLNKIDKPLQLISDYTLNNADPIIVNTNYFREVIYNFEHTVHHMALIKIGLKELQFELIPEGFGIAISTIKHQQKACAQ